MAPTSDSGAAKRPAEDESSGHQPGREAPLWVLTGCHLRALGQALGEEPALRRATSEGS